MDKKIERIREVVKVFKPRGWRLIEQPSNGKFDGHADGETRTIRCLPLTDTYALFVFLHEVGHVRCGHLRLGHQKASWLEEYEAEMWAINAMRAAGFPVTKEMLHNARDNVANHVMQFEHQNYLQGVHVEIDHEVLKFAFPDCWRDFI